MADGEGFKIAAGYVEIHLQDATEEDLAQIRAGIEDSEPFRLRTRLSDPDTASLDEVRARLSDETPIELATRFELPDAASIDEVRARVQDEPAVEVGTALDSPNPASLERIRETIGAEPPIRLATTLQNPDDRAVTGGSRVVSIPTMLGSPSEDQVRRIEDDLTGSPLVLPTELGAPSQSSVAQARVQVAAEPPITVGTALAKPSDAPVERAKTALEDEPPADVPTELGTPGEAKVEAARLQIAARPPIIVPTTLGAPSRDRLAAAAADIEKRYKSIEVPTEASDPITDAWRARIKAQIKAITGLTVDLPVNAKMAEYREEVLQVIGELESAVHADIPVQVAAADRFRAEVLALAKEVQAEVKANIPVEPTVDEKKAKDAGSKMSGLMLAGVTGGLAVGGPVIGTALVAGTAIGMAALGAYLQRGNLQIKAGWTQLANDAKASMTVASDGMVPPIKGALDKIDGLLLQERPAFTKLFTGAAQDVPILVDGLSRLTQNALPGLDNAMEHSTDIARGFSDVEADLGSVIGSVGDATARNATTIGTDMSQLGTTVQTVGSTLGDLIGISSNLGSGALPILNGALHAAEGGLHAADSAARPLFASLGTVGGVALTAWAGFKALSLAGSGLQAGLGAVRSVSNTAANGILSFGARVESAAPRLANMAQKTAGLVSSLGPAGLIAAAAGATIVIAALDKAQERAAQTAQDQAAAAMQVATALENNNGQITQTTRAQTAASLQGDSWVQSMTSQGISLKDITDASLGVPGALGKVQSAVDNLGGANTVADNILKGVSGGLLSNGDAANKARDALGVLDGVAQQATADQKNLADASGGAAKNTDDLAAANAVAAAQMSVLTTDTTTLADKSKDAATQLSALQDMLHTIAEDGAQKANDAIEANWKQLDQLKSSLSGAHGALLTANGDLNLTTTRGQAARDAIKTITDNVAAYAKQLNDQHVPATQMFKDIQSQVDQLAGPMAKSLGLTTSQVETLFAKEGLIPANIVTELKTPGLAGGISDFGTLFSKVAAIPPGKSITTKVEDFDSLQALQNLGYRIVHLPNGQVTITARDNATGTVNQIIRGINGRVAYLDIRGNVQVPGTARMSAQGNLFSPSSSPHIMRYAAGGMPGLTPMSGRVATVVPPDTWRVVGDNMTVPEVFAPLNHSQRTRDLLAQASAEEGVTQPAAGATYHQSITNYITQQPQEDGAVLAARVSAQDQWALTTMRAG